MKNGSLSSLAARVPPVLFVFACVVLSYWWVPNKVVQNGWLDPYVYTGLIADYRDTVERYGAVYYATRIAHIMPASAIYHLLGPEIGYHVHKIAYISACALATYFLAATYLNVWLSLSLGAWTAFNPQVIRCFLWDHYEGSALAYILVAMALAVRAAKRADWVALLLSAGAGVFFAFALNVNPTILVTGGAFGLAWLYLERRAIKSFLIKVAAFMAGFCAAYAVMIGFMYVNYPVYGPFFEKITWAMSIWGVTGGFTTWFVPLSKALEEGALYALLPFLVLFAMVLRLVKADDRPERELLVAATLFLAVVCALYAVSHWILNNAILILIYYSVYALPAELLGLIALLAYATRDVPGRTIIPWMIGVVTLLLFSWLDFPAFSGALFPLGSAGLIVAFVLASGLLLLRPRAPQVAGVITILLLVAWVPYRAANFNGIHRASTAAREQDVYRGALELMRLVKENAPASRGAAYFWYDNSTRTQSLNSIQSTHLWGYSRAQPNVGSKGMPELDTTTRENIERRRFLVLLAEQRAEVDAGLTALATLPRPFRKVREGRFQGQQWGYDYAVVEFVEAIEAAARSRGKLVKSVPLAGLTRVEHGTFELTPAGARLTTDERSGGWSATLALDLDPADRRRLVLRVRATVDSGRLGFQFYHNANKVSSQGTLGVVEQPTEIFLPLPDPPDGWTFMIYNAASAAPSVGTIRAVDLLEVPE